MAKTYILEQLKRLGASLEDSRGKRREQLLRRALRIQRC